MGLQHSGSYGIVKPKWFASKALLIIKPEGSNEIELRLKKATVTGQYKFRNKLSIHGRDRDSCARCRAPPGRYNKVIR